MKRFGLKIFVSLFLLFTFSVNAESIKADNTSFDKEILKSKQINKKSFIINCKKGNDKNNCTSIPVSSEKTINQNDAFFLGQRLYMDNYSPLNFNQYPKFIDNAFISK